ncbi:MAG TPA: hypothetical protein V6D11_30510 [Waterburya sp.]
MTFQRETFTAPLLLLPLLKFCQYFIRGELCHVVLLQALSLSDFWTPKNIIYLTDRIFARLPASCISES